MPTIYSARAIDSAEYDARLDRTTKAAVDSGVFGAPSFFVEQRMFFGNDRLALVAKAMVAA